MNDKNKQLALSLVENKLYNNPSMTYAQIEKRTGYSRRQLLRFAKNLKTTDKEAMLRHGNTGKRPAASATGDEIRFLSEFKKLHPEMTIARFQAAYQKEVIENPDYEEAVKKYHLKARSYSFFQRFYQNYYHSALTDQRSDQRMIHMTPCERREYGTSVGICAMCQAWIWGDRISCLHLMYDEATGSLLCGCFAEQENADSYLTLMKILLMQNGIPENLIFMFQEAAVHQSLCKPLARICERFGMELSIIPYQAQAAGVDLIFQQVLRLWKTKARHLIDSTDEELNRTFNHTLIPAYNRLYARFTLADNGFVPLPDNVELPSLIMIFVRKTDHAGRLMFRSRLYDLYDAFGAVVLSDTEMMIKENVFENTLVIYYRKQRLYPVIRTTLPQ